MPVYGKVCWCTVKCAVYGEVRWSMLVYGEVRWSMLVYGVL